MSQKVAARSFIVIAFFSFILVLSTALVIVRERSYELQTSAIFEEGTGGIGGSSQNIEDVEEFDRDLDGGSQQPSSGGPQQGGSGSSGSGGGATQPAPPPETCTGSCLVYGCSVSGRKSVSGSCNYGRYCCSQHQVVKLCAVEGDICGSSFGTVCCGGFSCSTSTSGFCRPGGASEGAIGAVSTECTDAGGQCVNAGSCGAAGLSSVNGGAGCALGVCCSKSSVELRLSCVTDGTGVSAALRGSCCNGWYEPTQGRYTCGKPAGGLAATPRPTNCTANGARWSSGVTCCSGTVHRRDGQEYCGPAPAYIIDIQVGSVCQRPAFAAPGVGQCRCNGRVINWGDLCAITFDSRVRTDPATGAWQVYVCDKNNVCQWVAVPKDKTLGGTGEAWRKDAAIVDAIYNENRVGSISQGGVVITVTNPDGTTTQVNINNLTPEQFRKLVAEGRITRDSMDQLVAGSSIATTTAISNSIQAEGKIPVDDEAQRKLIEERKQQIANDPTLTPTEKAILTQALTLNQNPYEVQQQAIQNYQATQGFRDWLNRTDAAWNDPNLSDGERVALLVYQAVDLVSLGQLSSAHTARDEYFKCLDAYTAGTKTNCIGEFAKFATESFLVSTSIIPGIEGLNSVKNTVANFLDNVKGMATGVTTGNLDQVIASARNILFGNQKKTFVTDSGLRITIEPNTAVRYGTTPPADGSVRIVITTQNRVEKTFRVSGEEYAYLNRILASGVSREEANRIIAEWVKRKLPYSPSIGQQIDLGLAINKGPGSYADYDNLTDVLNAIQYGLCDGVACDTAAAVTQGILTKGAGVGDGYHIVKFGGEGGSMYEHVTVYDSVNDVFIDPFIGVVDLKTMKEKYPSLNTDSMTIIKPSPYGTEIKEVVQTKDLPLP